MKMKPVGLLWDSASNNIGDQAIGLAMKRFCELGGVEFHVVDPFFYDANNYSVIIVGGGELIRGLGDPFYDQFRVEGRNILNSVGVHRPTDLEYLRDYQIVSVRSEKDKEAILNVSSDLKVEVCPCTTIIFDDLFPYLKKKNIIKDQPIIGVHINAAAIEKLPSFLESLQRLNTKYKIELIPFTLYQNDEKLLQSIKSYLPNADIFSSKDAFQVYEEIGKMDLMITSSLHAAIFSYSNNIPFLVNPIYPKIEYFLSERNLAQNIFRSPSDMEYLTEQLIALPVDYSKPLEQDRKHISEHLGKILSVLKNVENLSEHNKISNSKNKVNHNPAKIFHSLSMEIIKNKAELISLTLDLEEKEKQLEQAKLENINYTLSKSWRITRPLRKIMSLIMGGRN